MPRERKFTEDEVRAIRENPKELSQRELAKVYKCSQQAVHRIQKKKSYKDVEDGGKNIR
jgi:DNA-binding transcriptional regulator YiaG